MTFFFKPICNSFQSKLIYRKELTENDTIKNERSLVREMIVPLYLDSSGCCELSKPYGNFFQSLHSAGLLIKLGERHTARYS